VPEHIADAPWNRRRHSKESESTRRVADAAISPDSDE
jgi:hypothetical protein